MQSEDKQTPCRPQPGPSGSRKSGDQATASTSSSPAAAAAAPIDFGDASQYVEVSPIGTGQQLLLSLFPEIQTISHLMFSDSYDINTVRRVRNSLQG